MNSIRTIACAALIASLAACQGQAPSTSTASKPPAPTTQPTSSLGKLVDKEIREAREKLATENIGLNGNVRVSKGKDGGVSISSNDDEKDSRPKGEITPKGDLLIDGKVVAINADQRAMLMEYRAHVIGIAESGMDIGVQGADLAVKAMGEAFKGIFSGKSEQDIEKTVEAEAAKIKMSAAKLCGKLPAMLASQQKLAAALPEFKPYATMTQEDIADCMKDSRDDGKHAQLRPEIREEIRTEARESVRNEVRQAVRDDSSQSSETKPAQ